ncbi:MAG: outer membrane beta-barrel protein [Sphingobacterium sp.]|uniref:outer membrane beta-barrel protein n=1 Tax=Sphingobacterium sp. JB170 TaxID=1434842 RepID=UPI000B35A77D|nr:outer membrane beta-barrel protein [Sphingobacterium sp. JB170]
MKDNKNKELIEVIKQQLKNGPQLPYKEGAWESFKEKYETAPTRKALVPLWVAAAASVVVLAFGALFVFQNSNDATSMQLTRSSIDMPDSTENRGDQVPHNNSTDMVSGIPSGPAKSDQGTAGSEEELAILSYEQQHILSGRTRSEDTHDEFIKETLHVASIAPIHVAITPQLETVNPSVRNNLPIALFPDRTIGVTPYEQNDLVSGSEVDESYAYTAQAGRNISPKKVRLAKNVRLGAFVSPSATEQSFDLGGGLVLAYQISDKLAVRTGASFNQYEVGILGGSARPENGTQDAPPTAASGAALVSENVPYRKNNVMMPSLNSVSSKMQTLDVPLEIKYNLSKDYYIVGGASYAFVLSQERYNYYSEYTDAITYSSASDSDKPTSTPQKTVERKIKSGTDNVDDDGFGGFVNFSIGKKTGLTKNLNISIEPFVKIPVGSFKQTDMNYTNGGIRIITNF